MKEKSKLQQAIERTYIFGFMGAVGLVAYFVGFLFELSPLSLIPVAVLGIAIWIIAVMLNQLDLMKDRLAQAAAEKQSTDSSYQAGALEAMRLAVAIVSDQMHEVEDTIYDSSQRRIMHSHLSTIKLKIEEINLSSQSKGGKGNVA